MEDQFKLYILKSRNYISIKNIEDFLRTNTSSPDKLGPIRRDFKRSKHTKEYSRRNRFIILIKKSLFEKLIEKGYGKKDAELQISEYEIRSENRPPENSVSQYFFPYSSGNKVDLLNKLTYISRLGLIDIGDFYIHEEGIVEFSNNVTEEIRIIVKILIDTEECRISWCRHVLSNKIQFYFPENNVMH